MRKISLFLILFALCAIPVRAQEPDPELQEMLADIKAMIDDFEAIIPYHDSANHFSIMQVYSNDETRFLRVTMDLEVGQLTKDADWYLHYMTHNPLWDLRPLIKYEYTLRVAVRLPQKEKDSRGVAAFSFGPVELAEALMPPLDQQARTYIAGLARHIAKTLPHTIGPGETMVACRYNDSARVMTTVYQYGMEGWPEVRKYLAENMDQVRKDRAMDLVYDTVNHLAFVSYKGGVTLRHVYRNETGTDSLVMSIQPWMWKTVFERGAAGIDDPVINLRIIADEVQSTCPAAVDAYTTLLDCQFDTATLVLHYTYSTKMKIDERGKKASPHASKTTVSRQSLEEGIRQAYRTGQGRRMAGHIIQAGATVEYEYRQPQGKPVTIRVTPQQLGDIIR